MNNNYIKSQPKIKTRTKNNSSHDSIKDCLYGLYFHIPFCSRICSYCDFYKTANFDKKLINSYIKALKDSFEFFHSIYPIPKFYSLYLGGGSPGVYTNEYDLLFKTIDPFLDNKSEKTIELNPNEINDTSLSIWKSLGINRVSIGIQSFNEKALSFLNRVPIFSQKELFEKIKLTKKYFSNINIDLIYGIPIHKQESIFFKDLDIALSLDPQHLSLYCLTYNKTTPLGLKLSRNLIKERSSNTLASMYDKILDILNKRYIHEEISNWATTTNLAYHSNLYWSNHYYLGIGSSASGYLPYTKTSNKIFNINNQKDSISLGIRYHYPRDILSFIQNPLLKLDIEPRTIDSWLIEYIGATLRSINGINLKLIKKMDPSLEFKPTRMVDWAIKKGLIYIEDSILYLKDSEWFKENYWDLELINSFKKT